MAELRNSWGHLVGNIDADGTIRNVYGHIVGHGDLDDAARLLLPSQASESNNTSSNNASASSSNASSSGISEAIGTGIGIGLIWLIKVVFKLIYTLIGLLFKFLIGLPCGLVVLQLGAIGKTLFTLFWMAETYAILRLLAISSGLGGAFTIFLSIVLSLLVGAWTWLKHYDNVAHMSPADFASLMGKCTAIFVICFLTLGVILLGLFKLHEDFVSVICLMLALAVSCIKWISTVSRI